MAFPATLTAGWQAGRAARSAKPPRTSLLTHAARFVAKHAPNWDSIRTFALTVGGLGMLTYAAWSIALPLGAATAGVSLLLLEHLSRGGTS